jgi:hypothetical protein
MTKISQVAFFGICIMAFVWSSGYYFFKSGIYGKLLMCMLVIVPVSKINHCLNDDKNLLKCKLAQIVGGNEYQRNLLKETRNIVIDTNFATFHKNIQEALEIAAEKNLRNVCFIYAAACLICNPVGVGIGVGNFMWEHNFFLLLITTGGIWLLFPVLLSIIFSYFSQKPNYMAMRFFLLIYWLVRSFTTANMQYNMPYLLCITLLNYNTFLKK